MTAELPQHQLHPGTAPGRHVNFMRDIRMHLEAEGRLTAPMRVLSFGCSSGEECVDLAQVFPQASIVGAELVEERIAQARAIEGPRIRIVRSTLENLAANAPYDVILAMNVLCLTPQTRGKANVSGLYPFAKFDEAVAMLDGVLRPGGYLALYNAQYFLEDATVGGGYGAMPQPSCRGSGWVEKCDPTGARVCRTYFQHGGVEYDWDAWDVFLRNNPDVDRVKHGRYEQRWIAGSERPDRLTGAGIWRKADSPSSESQKHDDST